MLHPYLYICRFKSVVQNCNIPSISFTCVYHTLVPTMSQSTSSLYLECHIHTRVSRISRIVLCIQNISFIPVCPEYLIHTWISITFYSSPCLLDISFKSRYPRIPTCASRISHSYTHISTRFLLAPKSTKSRLLTLKRSSNLNMQFKIIPLLTTYCNIVKFIQTV